MTVWVVRAGRDLEFLSCFVSDDVVGIGWSELPRSPVGISRQELAAMLRATYPDAPPNTIANNTGQIWHFVNTIALADLVVVPLKASRSFRVGRVVGPAEHRDIWPSWLRCGRWNGRPGRYRPKLCLPICAMPWGRS